MGGGTHVPALPAVMQSSFFGTAGLIATRGLTLAIMPPLTLLFVGFYVFLLFLAVGSFADIHLNPVISWAVWFVDPSALSYMDSTYYIFLQYAGGCVSSWLLHWAIRDEPQYFMPVPPYSMMGAFFAEFIFSGLLCLVWLIVRDFDFRSSKYRNVASKTSTLDLMNGDSKILSSNSGKLGRSRNSRILVIKGIIFGATLATLSYGCRDFSGASLNPALCLSVASVYQMKHGYFSISFWQLLPYSLGPYVSSTLVALLYRFWRDRASSRRHQEESSEENEGLLRPSAENADRFKS